MDARQWMFVFMLVMLRLKRSQYADERDHTEWVDLGGEG